MNPRRPLAVSSLFFLSVPSLALCFSPAPTSRPAARSGAAAARMMSAEGGGGTRVAYLHGFASSSESHKGVALRKRMQELGLGGQVDTPDLNRPSFDKLTVTGALEAMDELHEKHGRPKWKIVGSSMGGHVAALWAARNADAVEKLVLLCPAFDLASIWPNILGEENFKKWEAEGELPFKDGFGEWQKVHYGLVQDAQTHDAWPTVPSTCPTLVIHGEQDEVIPVVNSLSLTDRWPEHNDLEIEVVQDDHGLYASTPRILARVEAFFGLAPAKA